MAAAFVGRIVIVGGAAAMGAAASTYSTVGEILSEAMRLATGGGGATGIDKKVDSLAQEMRAFMGRSQGSPGSTVIISGTQGSGGTSFSRVVIITAVPVGAYYYLRWRGFGLQDFRWVSSARFSEAVLAIQSAQVRFREAVTEQMGVVTRQLHEASTKISGVQSQVTGVQSQVADVDTRQRQLQDQVGLVGDQVGETNTRLGCVDNRVMSLKDQLDETQNQLSYTSKGIHLLCSVVSENMASSSHSSRELRNFASAGGSGPPSLGNSANAKYRELENDAPVLVDIAPALPSQFQSGGIFGGLIGGSSYLMRSTATPTPMTGREGDNPPEEQMGAKTL